MDVSLQATLTAGPSSATDSTFPSGSTSWPFSLTPTDPRGMLVDTGVMVHNVNSPSSYAALGGVGAAGPVTQASILFLRAKTPVLVRLTYHAGGGDFTAVNAVAGLLAVEADPTQTITLVEVQGAGTVELYAAGLQ